MAFYDGLVNILGKDRVLRDEPLHLHTTLKIGGPADFLVKPASEDELSFVLQLCRTHEVPCFVLGNGSNLLVSDAGYRGVIIKLWRTEEAVQCLKEAKVKEKSEVTLRIAAGTMLSRAAMAIANMGLEGFAFAAGIPGTVGGAIVMNAGAYGGEIKDCIVSARVMDEQGTIRKLSKDELQLGYRTSAIQGTGWIVLDADFCFTTGNKDEILAEIEELNQRRREKQPLEYPSAGSTFKRPEGYFAGKLIMDAGLAGYRIGDAQVSTKHCGFVINCNAATAADFYQLMQDVTKKVQEQFGVTLEPEVRLLGDF